MTPEQERKLNEVYEFIQLLKNSASIPHEVDGAFRDRFASDFVTMESIPNGLLSAPFASVSAPTGGVTVDSQARSAINNLITRIEDAGIILPN